MASEQKVIPLPAVLAASPWPQAQLTQQLGEPQKAEAGLQAREHQPEAIVEGERRRVTILFADVSGFTAMSEKLDPEEVYRLMNRCFERLGDVIARYEGTVDKFIGDCVMALFGAPVAHENDPERAVRAALDMQRELAAFSEVLKEQADIRLQMRIGLNSGVVIAGAVGSDQKRQYTVMGDAVNLASRIESAARPGGVLVSESIYRRTNRYFRFEAWEPIRVKGKEQPVNVYEVAEERSEPTATGMGRRRAVFIGREVELKALQDALKQSLMGKGRFLSVAGEAGMGKSRLLEEFMESMAGQEIVCLHGVCHANETDIPYQAWRGMLAQLCGIEKGDAPQQQQDKLLETLTAIDPALTEWLPYLIDIFGLSRPEARDALTAKRVAQQAVRNVVLSLAEKRGLALILDDIQWADPLSLEILGLLINDVSSSRLLLIAASRPDFTPSWPQQDGITTLNLKALSEDECVRLVCALSGADEVSPLVRSLTVERTGGNPFFLEELIQALIEAGALRRQDGQWLTAQNLNDIQLPETLEAIVMARIDRLAPDAKLVLQYAAVIGRRFPISVLQKVTSLNRALSPCLSELVKAEFIEEITPPPLWECGFRQAIFQEVACQMMLLQRRQQRHEAVALALEELYVERLEEQYEALAYHYRHSGNHPKAIRYLIKAGEKAQRLFATTNARKFFTDALTTIEQLSSQEREVWAGEALHCHEALGDVATLTGDYAEALAQYQWVLEENPRLPVAHPDEATDHAKRPCPARIRAAILRRKIGNVHTRKADFTEAIRWLREGLAEVEHDTTGEGKREVAKIWSELAGVSYRLGNYAEAAEQAAYGLSLAEAVQSPKEISDCCLVLGVVHHSAGDYTQADIHLRRSLQIREELGDLVGFASALNNLGNLASDKGLYEEADEFYRRSFAIRAKMAHAEGMSAALVNRGNVALSLGRYTDAQRHYQQALVLAERIGNAHTATFARLNLGRAQLEQGAIEDSHASLSAALDNAGRLGFQDLIALIYAEMARVFLLQGDTDRAGKDATEALEIAISIDSKFHQAVALRVLGTALAAQEQQEAALQRLRESLSLFEEMGAEHEIGRTCAALARIEQEEAAASRYRDRAKSIFVRLQAEGDLARLG